MQRLRLLRSAAPCGLLVAACVTLGGGDAVAQMAAPDPLTPKLATDPRHPPRFQKFTQPALAPLGPPADFTPPASAAGDTGFDSTNSRKAKTKASGKEKDKPEFKDRQLEGKVTQIAPMGVEKDNVVNFEVRVSIDNSTGELRANMTSNAEIVLEEHKGTLIVPERAVIYDAAHHTFAERVAPGTKTGRERVPLTLGVSNGTRTEVVKGLNAGERVVLQ